MYSCKLAKTTFDFKYSEAEKIPKSDKPTFSINNFRVLTSHLKSRNLINETKEPLLCSRPKTTPNFYWNFLNFEERKQTKSPPNIEKTLQRLNIRSFNNILRSNSMRKKPNPLPIRNALTPMKLEDTAKIRKSKKTEFYTLDHIKYNNYKYKKPILDENKLNPEKEKTNREVSMNEMCNGDLIEKLKANRIYYFEKNKLLLKKKFDRFYKMSESLKKMKHELHNCHISNKESHNPIKERNLGGTEKIKWESLFFNELNLLANLSNCVQKKINDKEIDEDFELNNIESFLRNSGDNYDDGLKSG